MIVTKKLLKNMVKSQLRLVREQAELPPEGPAPAAPTGIPRHAGYTEMPAAPGQGRAPDAGPGAAGTRREAYKKRKLAKKLTKDFKRLAQGGMGLAPKSVGGAGMRATVAKLKGMQPDAAAAHAETLYKIMQGSSTEQRGFGGANFGFFGKWPWRTGLHHKNTKWLHSTLKPGRQAEKLCGLCKKVIKRSPKPRPWPPGRGRVYLRRARRSFRVHQHKWNG